MEAQCRQPEECEHRQLSSASSKLISCRLANRISGVDSFQIEAQACEACCRFPLVTTGRVSPVVAAIALSSLDQQRDGGDTWSRFHQRHARQFAIQHLSVCDGISDGVTFHVPAEVPAPGGDQLNRRNSSSACDFDRPIRLGLFGRNSKFGLGYINRDIASFLDVDRWLLPGFTGDAHPSSVNCRVDLMSARPTTSELRAWLRGLDAVIFVEEPTVWAVTAIAREMGVLVICVPNWEWLNPAQAWLNHVDLMLAPTHFTAEHLSSWKVRFGFSWAVEQAPWPIDVQRFRFRRRYFCRRFIYVHGSGGATAQCVDSPHVAIRRKGLEVVLEAAAIANEVPIIIYGDRNEIPFVPSNVEFRPQPHCNTRLYDDGDVCIQPSRWEGLGLPLIECQAAGMPLITTDAPPMREQNPFAVVPSETVFTRLTHELHIPAACAQAEALASLLQRVRNQWIFAASGRARRFVEQEHAWSRRLPEIRSAIVAAINSK